MSACFCALVFATKGAAIIRIRANTGTKDILCFFIAHSPCIALLEPQYASMASVVGGNVSTDCADLQIVREQEAAASRSTASCPFLLWLVLRPSATLPVSSVGERYRP